MCVPGLFAQLSVVGSAVTAVMAGADSLTVMVVLAVTGAAGCGAGGSIQQRAGNFLGRVGAGGGGVVSVTVTSTVKLPVLFGVNVKSGLLLPDAAPFSFHA